MKWRPLGRVFETARYAQTPTPWVMDDCVRVYFAERDSRGKSFISFVDLDIDDPTKIVSGPNPRVLENGLPGTFDHFGQMPSFVMGNTEHLNLYFSGWNALENGSYHNASGVAHSVDGGLTFQRAVDGPILDRTSDEPYLAVTPSFSTGLCFYVSGLRWENMVDRYEPIYTIHGARSNDGLHFQRIGELIPQAHEHECFSRPWVMKINEGWHMWYCHRSALDYRDGPNAYRMGYALSRNGTHWKRYDDKIELPRSDWDATMQCYPAVFFAKDKLWMLYNGNTFGKNGFGIAVAE